MLATVLKTAAVRLTKLLWLSVAWVASNVHQAFGMALRDHCGPLGSELKNGSSTSCAESSCASNFLFAPVEHFHPYTLEEVKLPGLDCGASTCDGKKD